MSSSLLNPTGPRLGVLPEMRTRLHTLFVLAATFLGLSTAHAQLDTFDTRPVYGGSAVVLTSGSNMGQVFSSVYAVQQMTYNFFAGTGNVTGNTTMSVTFGEWNNSLGSFVSGTTVSFNSITINSPTNDPGAWTTLLPGNEAPYQNTSATFDLRSISSPLIDSSIGYLTDPSKSYALVLKNTGATTGLSLGLTPANDFTYGYGFPDGFGFTSKDWTFAQLVIATDPEQLTLTPVPESSTVAAIAGATFLTGLVIKRRRQKAAAAAMAAA